MGCFTRVQEVKILIHKKQPENDLCKGAQFHWHWEQHPDELFNVMLYLNDVENEADGGLQYLCDDLGNGIVDKGLAQYVGEDYANSVGTAKTVVGKAGDFFIFNNNMIHRAGAPITKDRNVVLYQIRPCSSYIAKQLDWNYLDQSFDALLRWD